MPALITPPATLPAGSIVDAYLRDSGGEGQDRSVASQHAELQGYCHRHGLILRRIYKDTRSGKSIAGRDDFERMIANIESEHDNPVGILLWDFARFARNTKDAIFNIARIENSGIVVHSLTDDIPEGEYKDLIRFVKHLGNEAERKKNSAAVKREMHQLVRNHRAMFGTPPRGFKREPLPPVVNERTGETRILHKWVPDPAFIPRIQRAFQLKAQGGTLQQIHNETGIFRSANSYKTFFANPIYIGRLQFGDMTIEEYCEPIIDQQTWGAVQKILENHANRQQLIRTELHPRRHAAAYLLSGLIHCAKCGSPLWGMTSRQRSGANYYRYACTRAKRNRDCAFKPIPARPLEKSVIENIRLWFHHPDNLRELIEASQEQNAEIARHRDKIARNLKKEMTAKRRAIARITDAIAESGHSKAMLQKLKTLEMEEIDLQTRLHAVTSQSPPSENKTLTAPQILTLSQTFATRLQQKDPAIIRQVLHVTVHRVTVDRNHRSVFGIIQLKHRPRETMTPDDDIPIRLHTVFMPSAPVGALLHKRSSIQFHFLLQQPGNPLISTS